MGIARIGMVAAGLTALLACSGSEEPKETGAASTETSETSDPTDTLPDTEDTEDTEDTAPEDTPYGPDNAWWHAMTSDVPADLEGNGFNVGDIAYNFSFVDLNGDNVELYQFYGKTIVLDLFAQWCGPCQDDAPELQACQDELGEDVVFISAMYENTASQVPSADDLMSWASAYGITYPLVADPYGAETGTWLTIGYPTYPVIGPDMTVLSEDAFPFSCSTIEGLM